jgi:hypothetical protein
VATPFVVALAAGIVAAVLAPGDLADNGSHADYSDFFATSAQLIGTLLVALVVEARLPFSRSGTVFARAIAASAACVIALGGFAAVLGLNPDLPNWIYEIAYPVTWGGLAGGLAAVALLGVSVVVATLRRVRRDALEQLRDLGDLAAADELARLYDDWGSGGDRAARLRDLLQAAQEEVERGDSDWGGAKEDAS